MRQWLDSSQKPLLLSPHRKVAQQTQYNRSDYLLLPWSSQKAQLDDCTWEVRSRPGINVSAGETNDSICWFLGVVKDESAVALQSLCFSQAPSKTLTNYTNFNLFQILFVKIVTCPRKSSLPNLKQKQKHNKKNHNILYINTDTYTQIYIHISICINQEF